MKKSFHKIAVAAVLGASLLGAGSANAGVKDKAAKKDAAQVQMRWFGTEVECDSNGGARTVTRFFGIPVSSGGTVENSAMCQ